VNSGSAYVFTRSGATWSQQAQLLASDATDHRRFGTSVAVDGDWAIVGAPSDYSGVAAQVYAFARSGGVWSEQQILSTLGGHDWFGYSLALDRDTALISAPLANIYRGRVDAYTRSGSTWTFQQSFAPTNVQIQDWFGTYAPGLVGDVVVISSSGSDVLGTDSGAAYVFARSGSTWSQVRELRGSQTNAYDEIGPTAFDGRTIVIGAPGAVQAGFGEVGEAYAFELTPGIDTYCTGKPNSMGCIPFVNACGGPSASSNSGFVITCFKVLDGKNGLMFYGYAPNSAPFQGGTLCVQPPTRRTPVQLAQNVVSNGSCRSVFTLDFNAWIASGVDPLLVPGANVYAQWWMRDPASASTTGLSNGVTFAIGP
jgi:hypothetical protein